MYILILSNSFQIEMRTFSQIFGRIQMWKFSLALKKFSKYADNLYMKRFYFSIKYLLEINEIYCLWVLAFVIYYIDNNINTIWTLDYSPDSFNSFKEVYIIPSSYRPNEIETLILLPPGIFSQPGTGRKSSGILYGDNALRQ